MSAKQKAQQPPEPPPFERRIELPMLQKIGIPLLLLLPILALASVFGETYRTVETANAALALAVESPTRTRYKMLAPMTLTVTNLAAGEPVTVTLEFSRDYIEQFSDLSFRPEVQEITPDGYRVEVPNLGAGETRVVTVAMQAEHYWRHDGQVSATHPAASPVSVPLETWVFP